MAVCTIVGLYIIWYLPLWWDCRLFIIWYNFYSITVETLLPEGEVLPFLRYFAGWRILRLVRVLRILRQPICYIISISIEHCMHSVITTSNDTIILNLLYLRTWKYLETLSIASLRRIISSVCLMFLAFMLSASLLDPPVV